MKVRITYTPDEYKKYINKLSKAYMRTMICPYCNSIDINRRYEYSNSRLLVDYIFNHSSIHTIYCTCRDCKTEYHIRFKSPANAGNLSPYFNILKNQYFKD